MGGKAVIAVVTRGTVGRLDCLPAGTPERLVG